jgi:hypothetical protein
MSTVRLKKPYRDPRTGTDHKANTEISVSWSVGKQLVADGTAEYPSVAAARPLAAVDPEVAAARKKITDLEAANASLASAKKAAEATIDTLEKDLEEAKKKIAELEKAKK